MEDKKKLVLADIKNLVEKSDGDSNTSQTTNSDSLELSSQTSTKTIERTSSFREFCKSRKKNPDGSGYGTGKRKTSIARVWIKKGTGQVTINKQPLDKYFDLDFYRKEILKPFSVTDSLGQYDVKCTVKGGGITGQAGAILHGIGRALYAINEDARPALKNAGILTRDARIVERKKYGQHKARKSTQFSKR